MKKPHLLISVVENLPGDFLDALEQETRFEGLNLKIERRPQAGPQAISEWLVLTAVLVYISKSYFDAFFQEMGREHYFLLKECLKIAWAKLISKERIADISVIKAGGQISKSRRYSLAFSIFAELGEDNRIKFLFENDLDEEAFNIRIHAILGLLKAIYLKEKPLDKHIDSDEARPLGRTIVIVFDEEKQKLVVLNPTQREHP